MDDIDIIEPWERHIACPACGTWGKNIEWDIYTCPKCGVEWEYPFDEDNDEPIDPAEELDE